jgi:tRNA (mo5U34)-methyltransferase
VSGDSSTDALRTGPWFHTIELPDGSCTPGVFDLRGTRQWIDWPALDGGRCLDVGTCDGFWAFEMERRGAAEVVAIDVDDPERLDLPRSASAASMDAFRRSAAERNRRFELAATALRSRVRRIACSVYDLDRAQHGMFDVVFCGTLLIHTREPFRALECMARVCRGDLLLVEPVDARLDLWRRSTPCARLQPAPMQWWRANTAGLRALLELSGWKIVSLSPPFLTPFGIRAQGPSAWTMKRLAAAPWLAPLAGLAFGSYDLAVRASPSSQAAPSERAHGALVGPGRI